MLDERFRLMYLSKDRADIKQISLTWKKFVTYATLAGVCFSLLVGGSVILVTKLTTNFKIIALENDKSFLQQQLLTMKNRVSQITDQLATVENTCDQLRDFAGLEDPGPDTRQLGVGGSAYSGSPEIGYYSEEIKKTAEEINTDLEGFLRSVEFEKQSLQNVALAISKRQELLDSYPSIMPVLGGQVNSKFGTRIDPFTKRPKMHHGIDIYAPKGTQALAAANGRVARVAVGKDYGNWIEIDHGNGFKSRYAHLSKVLVRRGQKVNRWDCIGEIGKTGRAQGYHLHYEVWARNQRKNPVDYIVANDR